MSQEISASCVHVYWMCARLLADVACWAGRYDIILSFGGCWKAPQELVQRQHFRSPKHCCAF